MIYAVVEVDNTYYPLATIAFLDKKLEDFVFNTSDLFLICRGIVSLLSGPIHRDAFDAEIRSAQSFYSERGGGREWLAANSIGFSPSMPDPSMESAVNWERQMKLLSMKFKEEPCPFPYLLSQLLRVACRAQTRSAFSSFWGPVPINTTYNGRNNSYGAVVVDITDLENIGFGLVAPLARSWFIEGQLKQTERTAEEYAPRKLLTATEYNAQFGIWSEESSQEELSNHGEGEMNEEESIDFFLGLRCARVDCTSGE